MELVSDFIIYIYTVTVPFAREFRMLFETATAVPSFSSSDEIKHLSVPTVFCYRSMLHMHAPSPAYIACDFLISLKRNITLVNVMIRRVYDDIGTKQNSYTIAPLLMITNSGMM